MILIDHSRSFRTCEEVHDGTHLYPSGTGTGPKLMSELPRAFVEKLKALTFESIGTIVGDYLKDDEIAAVLVRRDLILAEIDRLIRRKAKRTSYIDRRGALCRSFLKTNRTFCPASRLYS